MISTQVATPDLTPLPPALEDVDAAAIGTAGFTAMQCVLHLERSPAAVRIRALAMPANTVVLEEAESVPSRKRTARRERGAAADYPGRSRVYAGTRQQVVAAKTGP